MNSIEASERDNPGVVARVLALVGRVALMFAIPLIAFWVLYRGFLFLRAGDTPKALIAVIAILWGVGGVALLYWIFNWLVESLPKKWTARLQPYVFVGPAMAILTWYLALPTLRTFWLSLFGRDGPPKLQGGLLNGLSALREASVGLSNYVTLFTDRQMWEAIRNNIVFWILIGVPLTVAFGLLVAVLSDRVRWERLAKSLIFLPMAISFVGAGVIWNFVYAERPLNQPQIGLLNAIMVTLGGQPQNWPRYASIIPWNNVFLVIIMVWLQAGFAMVLFSAALKGIPGEMLEAARVDGATEVQVFFRIMIPHIRGTIVTVTTTVVIFTLKIFDVVWVMTGGRFGTEVIATNFYRTSFTALNRGLGSAIAIILLIAVIPVMVYNLRQFREREGF